MIIAPLWRRLAAMLYDTVILIALWIVTGFLVTAAFGIEQARTVEASTVNLNPYYQTSMFANIIITALLFFGWFWTHSGQTLGMQAWKIKVQNSDGSAINWQQVLLRFFTAPVALGLGGLGYWWALLDTQKRSWCDIASKSVVVKIENFSKKAD